MPVRTFSVNGHPIVIDAILDREVPRGAGKNRFLAGNSGSILFAPVGLSCAFMASLFRSSSSGIKTPSPALRWAFAGLLLIGIALRCYVSFAGLAMLHNDEHQQYLEQAHRIVYGYGQSCWEQKLGMRHLLYPALIALP